MRGSVTFPDTVCTDGRQKVDVSSKMGMFVCGLPVLGGVLLVAWALADSGKKTQGPADTKEQG
jgi:hypothetical protein